MRIMRFLMTMGLAWLVAGSAMANEVFRGDVSVDVGGVEVDVPAILDVSASVASDTLSIVVLGDITPLLEPIAVLLEADVPRMGNACEKRIRTDGIAVTVQDNALTLTGKLRAEIWICGIIKTRVGRESGTVTLSVQPDIVDGQLQLGLARCGVSGLNALSKALNLEAKLCASAKRTLTKENADPGTALPPLDLAGIGYRYVGFQLFEADGTALLVADLEGPNSMRRLVRHLAGQR